MKRLALFFTIAAALLLTPAGAFAKDKHKHTKHKHHDHECRDDDHRSSYYGRSPSYYNPGYDSRYRSSYSAPVYYSPYRSNYSDRNCSSRSSGGVRLYFGF